MAAALTGTALPEPSRCQDGGVRRLARDYRAVGRGRSPHLRGISPPPPHGLKVVVPRTLAARKTTLPGSLRGRARSRAPRQKRAGLSKKRRPWEPAPQNGSGSPRVRAPARAAAAPPLASAVLWRADHKLHFPGRDAAAKGLPGHSSARTSALPGPPRRWCPTRTAFHQRKVSCHLEPCCHAVPLVWALIMVPTCSGLCFPSALCPGWHSNCQTTHPGNS